MSINKIKKLLDFSEWTLNDIQSVEILSESDLAKMEDAVTNDIDGMSQLDHVNMVVTYKAKIKELEAQKSQ